jgi:hypothetical protein
VSCVGDRAPPGFGVRSPRLHGHQGSFLDVCFTGGDGRADIPHREVELLPFADAIQAVHQAGRHVGEVLASAVSLLNPAFVVIGGPLSEAGEHLLAGARELIYARSMPLSTQRLTVFKPIPALTLPSWAPEFLQPDYALSREGLRGLNRMEVSAS